MKVITGTLEALESFEQRATAGAAACLPLALILPAEELKAIRAALETETPEPFPLAARIRAELEQHLGDLAHRGRRRLEALALEAAGSIEIWPSSASEALGRSITPAVVAAHRASQA